MALQAVRYPANPNLIVYFDASSGTFYLDSAGKYPVTGPSSTVNAGPLPSANPQFNVPIPGTTNARPGGGGLNSSALPGETSGIPGPIPGLPTYDPMTGSPSGGGNVPSYPTPPGGLDSPLPTGGGYQGPGLDPNTGMPTGTANPFSPSYNTNTQTGQPTSIWDKIAKVSQIAAPFIPLAGSYLAANANTQAAQIQAASADKALALQKEMYEQTRADLGPYRDLGLAALGQLAGNDLPASDFSSLRGGGGSTTPAPGSTPGTTTRQMTPSEQQSLVSDALTRTPPDLQQEFYRQRAAAGNPYFAAGQSAAQGGTVTLTAPDGKTTRQFAANDPNIPHYLAQGATQG